MGGKYRPASDKPKSEVKIKAKHAACTVCRGRSYKVPGMRCSECNRRRNTNTCPSCGGLPERVEGVEGSKCPDCGTPAGKNQEYKHPPRSHGTAKMDGL